MPSLPVVGKAHEAGAGAPFVWFVYGSSLDRGAFAHWAGEHGYRVPDFSAARPARLDGFRLAFDVQSRFWGGAVASLREAPGEHVEGLALPMAGDARGLVDHKEGAISGLYAPFDVTLTVDGKALAAVAYRAARPLPNELAPSRGFVETLVRGAAESQLSAAWQEKLRALL
jgi:gamma-glutamylcyclotransferase